MSVFFAVTRAPFYLAVPYFDSSAELSWKSPLPRWTRVLGENLEVRFTSVSPHMVQILGLERNPLVCFGTPASR